MVSQKGKGAKLNNPDRGNPMQEGMMEFDKGYESDHSHFDPYMSTDDNYRGNQYMKMQNEIVHRDSPKLKRSKFSKIA